MKPESLKRSGRRTSLTPPYPFFAACLSHIIATVAGFLRAAFRAGCMFGAGRPLADVGVL
jgi:hypothetical protein